MFVLPIPRTAKERREFIVQHQITYPLPVETLGVPTMVEDKDGKRGILTLRENGEYKSKELKIVKRDGGFYWDSWKEQKLHVVRGHYYITNFGLASTIFISADGDGMIFIFNPVLTPIQLCPNLSTSRHRVYKTKYMEIRSGFSEPNVTINGTLRSMFYPDGFEKPLCDGDYLINPPFIYFKPSIYKQLKSYLFSMQNIKK
ncbi:MAG: hypothetical protein ACRBB3_07380 [Alphaproteobacteria bacterium]